MYNGGMSRSGEEDRIDSLLAVYEALFRGVPNRLSVGNGVAELLAGADAKDDCAIFSIDGPLDIVAGSDYVRGPKFTLYELGVLTDFDIGYYVAVANLSDIAAMGALPLGVLSVIRYPKDLEDDAFLALAEGIGRACADHDTRVLGGDIGGAERIILSASALGAVERGKALRRNSAQIGDDVYVTGPTGTAGAAVIALSEYGTYPWDTELRLDLENSWRPRARFAEARALVELGLSRCAQDTSDGLKASLDQIAAASGVAIIAEQDRIPIPRAVVDVGQAIGLDPLGLTLSASVDFELVFTAPPDVSTALLDAFVERGLRSPVKIGIVAAGERSHLKTSDGEVVDLPGVPWQQQEGNVADTIRRGLSG